MATDSEKIDLMQGSLHQIQVDIAEMKAKSGGESANMSQRITALEKWQDSVNKTLIGIFTGIFISVVGAFFFLLLKGGLKL